MIGHRKSSRVVPPLGTSDKSKPVEEDVEEEGLENGKTTMDDTEKNDDVMVEKLPTRFVNIALFYICGAFL